MSRLWICLLFLLSVTKELHSTAENVGTLGEFKSQLAAVVADVQAKLQNYELQQEAKLRTGKEYADCDALYKSGERRSGVYKINPNNGTAFEVYCDMSSGGWVVLLRRYDGSVSFKQNWSMYKSGFGNPRQEFWLGNDHINLLTNNKKNMLRIEYVPWYNNNLYQMNYNTFRVENEAQKYKLHVGGASGNGSNALYGRRFPGERHNGMYFTTIDRDNDRRSWGSCAADREGGFWYNACSGASPTGPYKSMAHCMKWYRGCTKRQIWKIKPL